MTAFFSRSVCLALGSCLLACTQPSESTRDVIPVVPWPLDPAQAIEDPTPPVRSGPPRGFMLFWNDTPYIDGDFVLVIHPTQIFLRSMHNNPNPNHVYWLAALSEEQYENLSSFLRSYEGTMLSKTLLQYPGYQLYDLADPKTCQMRPDRELTDRDELAWQQECRDSVNENLHRLLRELNRAIAKASSRLPESASASFDRERVRINGY